MKGLIEQLREYPIPYSGAAGEARVEQGLQDAGVGTVPVPQQVPPAIIPQQPTAQQPIDVNNLGLLGTLLRAAAKQSQIPLKFQQ